MEKTKKGGFFVEFNKADFIVKLERLQEVSKEKSNLEYEISRTRQYVRSQIMDKIKPILYQVFPQENVGVQWGYAEDNRSLLNIDIDLTDYLVMMYKERFPKEINRRYKHCIKIKTTYDMMNENFEIWFLHEGMSSIIKNETLHDANRELMWNIAKSIERSKYVLSDVITILQQTKKLLDNYDAYLLAFELEKVK